MPQSDIVIRGAREHNLRDVDLRLPRNQLVVMTGVSGSGKSSLAFDTLYAEGQRRYVESLSSYARQFLGQMPKPDVDAISGLSPSISIQQKTSGRNPRSTVGTITEVYDYLRVLFARVGQGHCARCNREITAQGTEQIVESISHLPDGTRFQVLAPIVQQQKGEFRDLFADLRKQGFLRARADGQFVQLTDELNLDRQMRHSIEVVVDRLTSGRTNRSRLTEAVETALNLADGKLIVVSESSIPSESAKSPARSRKRTRKVAPAGSAPQNAATDAPPTASSHDRLYSSRYACTHCGISYEPPAPQLFSFNSPQGMCTECHGLGMRHDFGMDRLIAEPHKSIWQGAIPLLGPMSKVGRWRRHIYQGVARAIESDLDWPEGTFLKTPWQDLPEAARQSFLYGMGDRHITFAWRYSGGVWKHGGTYGGFISDLLDSYRKTHSSMRRRQLEKYMAFVVCPGCGGSRLNSQARSVMIDTAGDEYLRSQMPARRGLADVCALSIRDAALFFEKLKLDDTGQLIAAEVLKEIRGRLGFLRRCGLDYLTLDRAAPTLSGGESQRIRLAGQIGCGLVGVVYILDEPSIGLHPRDNRMLLDSLCDLRDQGNTVIVVEHDEETMRAADHIVDFGPGPGVRGGEVVAQGTLDAITRTKASLTGQFLASERTIPVPAKRRKNGHKSLKVVAAAHNNLKGIDVTIPLESFVCVTGVSGSGKSSLVNDILWQVLNREVNKGKGTPGAHGRVNGLSHLDKAIDIDQSPIGRTPRSNPATYVKLLDHIRALFTKLPDSRMRGYKPGRFSFNVATGRCEACEGYGATKLEMDFLADIWVTCPVCEGHRFSHETLAVRFKDANIADVLEMDVQQALEHFENHPKIVQLLKTLHDVGLDYMKLGQASPTLSGGEAQRIKLARELGKRSTGQTIYLLDEPTTGLHFADIEKLLEVLHGFVDAGNTVLVVEHNLEVIKTADWIIDLGPEGGEGGGRIVAEGPPETIVACEQSYTGQSLAAVLAPATSGTQTGGRRRKKTPAPNLVVAGVARRGANAGAGRIPPERSLPSASAADRGKRRREIVVNGAAQHNLQNIDVCIPRDRLSVFCGPSGSGKSSLAMDTLYAEGQRRYVESLSAYARQFLGQMPKPRVEHIHGLSPAIAIEQKTTGTTPRSTVGTVTEIYDYLRVLFARLGTLHCPECHSPVRPQTTDEILDRILDLPKGTRLILLAPQEVAVGQSYERLWQTLKEQGFPRVRIDGVTYRLEDVPDIDRRRRHQVEIVVDRVSVSRPSRGRIADSVEAALQLGRGLIRVAHVDESRPEPDWQSDRFSLLYACEQCGRSFEELTPHNFSFNSSLGWCPACEGIGTQQGTNLSALIDDSCKTLAQGAVGAWPDPVQNRTFRRMLEAMAQQCGIPLDVPFDRLDPLHKRMVLYGTGDRWIGLPPESADATVSKKRSPRKRRPTSPTVSFQYKGLYPAIEEASRVSYPYRQQLRDLVGEVSCSVCHGSRLRDDVAAVRFHGKTLQQVCELPLNEALGFLKKVRMSAGERKIVGDLLHEATSRLAFLVDVGLHYVSLSRSLPTLSGGETQRIQLAGQIGRALTGVLYVLDEPTIGLHPRDNARLLRALKKLRDLGNTLVLVEHDREVLKAADRLYDFGPGAGRLGGTIVGQGTPKQLCRTKALTGQFLADKREIPIPTNRRMPSRVELSSGDHQPSALASRPTPPGGAWLELLGARQHNLRNVDLRIPLGTLTCVTGVSGSGKSSLIEHTLARAVAKRLHRSSDVVGPYDELLGLEHINKIIVVDQQPLGSTPKSNPGTYTGVFEHIRELFSRLPDARVRGYRPGRFSFNRAGGRCDVCEGNGQRRIEMHFLPDVWVECDQCRGKRYNQETLSVTYRGHSIADVLDLPIGRVAELFKDIPKIRSGLATLCAIGLDYLTLGQPAPTLSGGEAQRVKLAAELSRPHTGKTLYLLDEPTTGLHFDDIDKLLKVLNSLVHLGNTVIVIEHNLDVIKTADWIIDLGPEAGDEGGWIVAEGTPEDIVHHAQQQSSKPTQRKPTRKTAQTPPTQDRPSALSSPTGEMLGPVLETGRRAERTTFDVKAARRRREGDVDLKKVGREAQMPWQRDGRRWHTADRIAHNGRPGRWEGQALERVVDVIEEGERFRPANWNDRSVVEITGANKKNGWFLHALTGNEWLLALKFRVRRNQFKQDDLRGRLALKALDDIDELPIYGRSQRVRVKNLKGPWQEVTISVHWLKEIDTPEFWEFLSDACQSFLQKAIEERLNLKDLTPWKVLGRKWHLSRKGFPSAKRVAWDAQVVAQLTDLLAEVVPDAQIDWGNKQVVYVRKPGEELVWAAVHTKRRGGVDLSLFGASGRFALGGISEFGTAREVKPYIAGCDMIKIRFTATDQFAGPEFQQFLRNHARN